MCDPASTDRANSSGRAALAGLVEADRALVELLARLSPEQIRARATPGSDLIGEHVRHCIDHVRCFLRGLPDGLVDYDARDRDPGLGGDAERLSRELLSFEPRLWALATEDPARPLRVRSRASTASEPVVLESTLARELAFLSSHAIHHLAIARVLAEAMGATVPPDLGVAYSTLAHRASAAGRG